MSSCVGEALCTRVPRKAPTDRARRGTAKAALAGWRMCCINWGSTKLTCPARYIGFVGKWPRQSCKTEFLRTDMKYWHINSRETESKLRRTLKKNHPVKMTNTKWHWIHAFSLEISIEKQTKRSQFRFMGIIWLETAVKTCDFEEYFDDWRKVAASFLFGPNDAHKSWIHAIRLPYYSSIFA